MVPDGGDCNLNSRLALVVKGVEVGRVGEGLTLPTSTQLQVVMVFCN